MIWAAIGQAWVRESLAGHSKLFIDWCSELTEISSMSSSWLYFENFAQSLQMSQKKQYALRLMCKMKQLWTTLKLNFVIGKCCREPFRHVTVREWAEFASESRYSTNMMSELKKNLSRDQFINDVIVATSSANETTCSLQTEKQKYWKTHRWINGDMSKVSKTLPK